MSIGCCENSSIQADGTAYEHPQRLELSNSVQRVTAHFAMLSFTGTSHYRLACRLEGFDNEETVLDEGRKSGGGKQFDPEIARPMMDMAEEKAAFSSPPETVLARQALS